MKTGYTLVELMVTVTIIVFLTSFGISAYGKAQTSQATKTATETILSALSEAQKKASTGTSDCGAGVEYFGQKIVFQNSNIALRSTCSTGDSAIIKNISVPGVTFTATSTFIFRPLSQGVILSGGNTNISYSAGSSTYLIQVMPSGSIVNQGKQ